jgi:hypothetical protein|tara:strand:- start:468 stop:683 length:216 start_codon:yes stop_codon:yes gene_type:complete
MPESLKDQRIKELEDKLSAETVLKRSETLMNKDLKEQLEKKDLHIKTLLELNESFSNKIAKLRVQIKKLID